MVSAAEAKRSVSQPGQNGSPSDRLTSSHNSSSDHPTSSQHGPSDHLISSQHGSSDHLTSSKHGSSDHLTSSQNGLSDHLKPSQNGKAASAPLFSELEQVRNYLENKLTINRSCDTLEHKQAEEIVPVTNGCDSGLCILPGTSTGSRLLVHNTGTGANRAMGNIKHTGIENNDTVCDLR